MPEDLEGGTFTISNGWHLWFAAEHSDRQSAAECNSGIALIQERPIARDGQVIIRPMMYLHLPMITASSTAVKLSLLEDHQGSRGRSDQAVLEV